MLPATPSDVPLRIAEWALGVRPVVVSSLRFVVLPVDGRGSASLLRDGRVGRTLEVSVERVPREAWSRGSVKVT